MWIPCVLRLDVKNPRLRPFAFRAELDVSDDAVNTCSRR